MNGVSRLVGRRNLHRTEETSFSCQELGFYEASFPLSFSYTSCFLSFIECYGIEIPAAHAFFFFEILATHFYPTITKSPRVSSNIK
jgi:hypothetical protein